MLSANSTREGSLPARTLSKESRLKRFLTPVALLGVLLTVLPLTLPTTTAAASSTCSVDYTLNQWNTGFTANVTIHNSGAAINGWTLGWSFSGNQQITNAWSATVTQVGAQVTAQNASYNASIPTGGSANFGFQATSTGTNAVPTNFTLNGIACGDQTTPTSVPTTVPTAIPTAVPTTGPTSVPTAVPTTGPTSVPTAVPTTGPTATPVPGTSYTGNGTYFDGLGSPYGGCGLPQSAIDSQNFVALNVQNTPGDYSTFFQRPISSANASKIGFYNNGLNCGRWVRVTIGDYCTGVNDGAPNAAFCRNGGWVADSFNGATLDLIVADSCQDGNAWCRDDANHLDFSKNSLSLFTKNGAPAGDMLNGHWNNRQIHWQFIPAPNYTGDIKVGFIQNSAVYWAAIAISNLPNGIHGVEYYNNGTWKKATMNGDMGQSYVIDGTSTAGTNYQIRIYDVNDQLINGGRVYSFSRPSSCGTQCGPAYTAATVTGSN
ncbi:hypothetical protein F8S13_22960 [Chloroflexia bacterium SDU3-3]|nr:hypothetical protein F8S13_22960 [Chloroflexia bacterium SDU3-3]